MKEFIRNFRKQKIVGFLNIGNLSLGIMVAIVIGLWAINELSYDKFQKNRERIYHLTVESEYDGAPLESAFSAYELIDNIGDKIPGLEDFCRVAPKKEDLKINNVVYSLVPMYLVDPNFFSFFSFNFKKGSAESVFAAPDQIVISERAANRYYPGMDPIGELIHCYGDDYRIAGVIENMPSNSSLQADIIFPIFGKYLWSHQYQEIYMTFLLYQEGVDLNTVNATFQEMFKEYSPGYEDSNIYIKIKPFDEIHFGTKYLEDPFNVGNKMLVSIFILVACVILIISCINFANLFVSSLFLRAKSVGIKKSQGCRQSRLVWEFYKETMCYVFIAVLLGLILAGVFLPVFNTFTQSSVVLDFASPLLYVFLLCLFLLTVLIAGTFPAFYITGFNPINTLYGRFKGKKVSFFQKSLLVLQFTASIALLIVVMFMQRQVNFMIAQDLGFEKENIVYVVGHERFGQNYQTLRDEVMKSPNILDVTTRLGDMGEWTGVVMAKHKENNEDVVLQLRNVKDNYFDFFDISFIYGENPFYDSTPEGFYVVVNETAARLLGLGDNPVDQHITLSNSNNFSLIVKGVIRDIQDNSFHSEVNPQVYLPTNYTKWCPVFFKITGNPEEAINVIKKEWNRLEYELAFEYHFLDDTYEQLYRSEMNANKVLFFAMLIAFLISVAGLFSMTYYTTQLRIREIALRKVNGATLKDLLVLLNKDFILWIGIAYLLASVIAYGYLHVWLGNFIVKVSLNLWMFLLVGVVAFLVTLLTASYQTWKVANINPVKALKDE